MTDINITDEEFYAAIREECVALGEMLVTKNRMYGNAIMRSPNVFSKTTPLDKVNDRLDDKLSRVMSGQEDDMEDAKIDIAGYLILERVIRAAMSNAGREVVQKAPAATAVEVPAAAPAETKPGPKKRAPRKKKANPIVEAPAEEVTTTLNLPEETVETLEPVKTEESDLLEVSAEELLGALGEAAEEPVETISEEGMLGLL